MLTRSGQFAVAELKNDSSICGLARSPVLAPAFRLVAVIARTRAGRWIIREKDQRGKRKEKEKEIYIGEVTERLGKEPTRDLLVVLNSPFLPLVRARAVPNPSGEGYSTARARYISLPRRGLPGAITLWNHTACTNMIYDTQRRR